MKNKTFSIKGIATPVMNQVKAAISDDDLSVDAKLLRESLAHPLKIFMEAQTKPVIGSSILSGDFTEAFRSTAKNFVGFTEADVLAVLFKAGIALGIQVKVVPSGYLMQTVLRDRSWVSTERFIEIVPITEEPTAKKAIKMPRCEAKKEEVDGKLS